MKRRNDKNVLSDLSVCWKIPFMINRQRWKECNQSYIQIRELIKKMAGWEEYYENCKKALERKRKEFEDAKNKTP